MDGVMSQDGRLPLVREVADPVVFGVHPGPAGDQATYVPRDRHDDIVASLRPGAFVLVTGPALAGKSRCAFEAVAAALPRHTLVMPRNRASLGAAVAAMVSLHRSVLWLDGDLFPGGRGLESELLARTLDRGDGHRVVVGTMNSTPLHPGPPIFGAGGVLRRFPVASVAALNRAQRFELSRRFSPGELQRARALSSDPRVAAALGHPLAADLAAVLAGAPGLLAAWRTAAVGANPRGAALVAAALDCRLAGLDAAPADLLDSLGRQYLQRSRPGSRNTAATEWEWPVAWEWAVGTGVLREVQGRFRVSDYLLEHAGSRRDVPDATLRAALDHADEVEAALIGETAHRQGRVVLASTAYRRAYDACVARLGSENPASLEIARNLSVLHADRGQPDKAVAGLLDVLDVARRVLGSDDPSTLAAVQNLAAVTCEGAGASSAALARADAALEAHERVLGEQHPATLGCRHNLGVAFARSHRYTEAVDSFRRVAQQNGTVLGGDHPVTLATRDLLATALGAQGSWAEATAEREAVLRAQRRLWGDSHPATLTSRHERAVLLRGRGQLDDALEELGDVLAARTAILGAAHTSTLSTRQLLAEVRSERGAHELGDLDGLAEELEAIRVLRNGLLGPDHPATVDTRHAIANLLWDLGDVDGAAAGFGDVLAARTRTLGPDAAPTLSVRHDLAVLEWERGDLERATGELAAVAESRARLLGDEHPATVAARHDRAAAAAILERIADAREAESREHTQRHLQGVDLFLRGDYDAADPLLREAFLHHARTLGSEHPLTLDRAHDVATVLHRRGFRQEAAAVLRVVVTARCAVLDEDDPATLAARHDLGVVLWELGDVAGAVGAFEAALTGRIRVLGTDHPTTITSRDNHRVALARLTADRSAGRDDVPPSKDPGELNSGLAVETA